MFLGFKPEMVKLWLVLLVVSEADRLRLVLLLLYLTTPVVAWSVVQLIVAEVAVLLETEMEVIAGVGLGAGLMPVTA